MKIALAQIRSAALDMAANASRSGKAIDQAATSGADLVVLPELITTGWVMENPSGLLALAEPGDATGPVLSRWREAARVRNIAIVGGFVERDGDRYYNSAIAIDRGGHVRGVYRKLHLFSSERGVLEQGNVGLPIFELAGHRVGILICYDLRFPEAMRLLALGGAEVVAVPTAWVGGFDPGLRAAEPRIGQVDAAIVQANLNQVFVACADTVGRAGENEFLGRSLIVDPFGKPIAGPASAVEEELVVAGIDPGDLKRAHHRGDGISPRSDRRTDVYSLSLNGDSSRGATESK